jgi:hypothetical protein
VLRAEAPGEIAVEQRLGSSWEGACTTNMGERKKLYEWFIRCFIYSADEIRVQHAHIMESLERLLFPEDGSLQLGKKSSATELCHR